MTTTPLKDQDVFIKTFLISCRESPASPLMGSLIRQVESLEIKFQPDLFVWISEFIQDLERACKFSPTKETLQQLGERIQIIGEKTQPLKKQGRAQQGF